MLRIALYIVFYQLALAAHVVLCLYISNRLEKAFGVAAVAPCVVITAIDMVLLAVICVYDAVRWTHRLLGPLYRIRQTMKAVAAGEEVGTIRLRKGDLLLEMRDDFNDMLRALDERGAIALRQARAEEDLGHPPALRLACAGQARISPYSHAHR
jgi:hypothetical protein